MDVAAKQWVETLLKKRGLSMKEASVKAGQGETFVRDILRRGSDPSAMRLARLAGVLGVEVTDLLRGSDKDATVPIVGYVGAGAMIIIDELTSDAPLGFAEAPPGSTQNTVAVEVRGDSMAGIADNGWLIFYDRREDAPDLAMVGELCVLWCDDGRVLVKKLYPGSKSGCWNLLSTTARTLESDVPVKHAALVNWIKPRRK